MLSRGWVLFLAAHTESGKISQNEQSASPIGITLVAASQQQKLKIYTWHNVCKLGGYNANRVPPASDSSHPLQPRTAPAANAAIPSGLRATVVALRPGNTFPSPAFTRRPAHREHDGF